MKKGFTLVELLGTIVILSLIVIVAFPSIISQIKRSNETIDSSVVNVVKASARQYLTDNKESYPKALEGQTKTFANLNVLVLIENGYLEESFADKHCEIKNDTLTIKSDSQKYIIEYNEVGGDDDC